MSDFMYKIGEKFFIQRALVMGQAEQLMQALEGIEMPKRFSPAAIKKALGEKLYLAMAIALVEEGKSPKRTDEELSALAEELHWSIKPEQTIAVIEDFFDCNPAVSILEKLAGMARKVAAKISDLGSLKRSFSFQKETSQSETKSSGDIPSERPSPISGTAAES
jgi:hypothetical protein